MDHETQPEPRPSTPRRNGLVRTASLHLRALVTAALLLVAMGAGVGIDRYLLEFSPAGAQSGNELAELDEFGILSDTYSLIRENYVESDEVTDEQLIYGASRGMIDALGDEGHSTFLDPEEADVFEASSRGELIGIGIQIDTEVSPPVVIMPIQGSPAFEAGIEAGDEIVAVDGVDTTEIDDPEDVGNLIRGDEGTDVTLELRHEGEEDTYEVTITRSRIDLNPVSWAMLPEEILWIRLSEFSSGATEGVQEALREGKARGAKGVILDLRANPGGLVFEAIGVGSQFLPNDTVLYQEQDVDGAIREVRTVGSNGEWQQGPLVVLVNDNSASAAEIVSSSIRDNERGEVLGVTTFGTGTVLLPFELEDGSLAVLGTELWLTAEGEEIWKKGVDPTIEVELDPEADVALPYTYAGNVVPEDVFTTLLDNQLIAAYEEVLEAVEATGT
ncbi:MAG TPA: S41 family peptidase [Thermomicrobiales bacterium]|nr:S41 family peptidase [Thermomicrobiales bacterium]